VENLNPSRKLPFVMFSESYNRHISGCASNAYCFCCCIEMCLCALQSSLEKSLCPCMNKPIVSQWLHYSPHSVPMPGWPCN